MRVRARGMRGACFLRVFHARMRGRVRIVCALLRVMRAVCARDVFDVARVRAVYARRRGHVGHLAT